MSFYRVGQNRRKRAPLRKKPVWDDTVQDLTVHKATPEEIMLRKEAHKSKNHLSVKLEKIRTDKQNNKLTGAETQQLAIMKEILYDQSQLQNVLARSDTMMAVVKDLFGDDPKRFMGFPNVTTAPHHDGDHSSLVASMPDIYTRIEKLSDSLMDQSALNDDLDESYSEDEIDQPDPISYESKLNLKHFQDYLQEEKGKTDHMAPKSSSRLTKTNSDKNMMNSISTNNANMGTQSEMNKNDSAQVLPFLKSILNPTDKGDNQIGNLPDPKALASFLAYLSANPNGNFQTPTKRTPLPSERTPPSAMNDTKKIRRSKKVMKSPKASSESMNTTTASMNDMRMVLQELEGEIAAYERQTGRRAPEESHKTETFSGYTVALVTAVSRLARYLKETDLRVRTEGTLREQLTQDVYELRTIIDAFATDLIVTQEEYAQLHSQYKRYRETTEAELASVNNHLRELTLLVTGKEPRAASGTNIENQQQQMFPHQQQNNHKSADTSNISKQLETSKTSSPLYNQHANPLSDVSTQSEIESGTYQPLPARFRPSEMATAAIMLSPPVRKTRVSASNRVDAGVQLSQRQASLVDIPQLTNEGRADPPRLTQTPPVMNTVSVPRPIPLVQSNVSIPLTSGLSLNQAQGYTITNLQGVKEKEGTSGPPLHFTDLVHLRDKEEQQLQEMALEEALNNPDMQSLMQAQIAELNRQQEEAKQRLLDLLDNQRARQKQLHDQLGSDNILDSSFREAMGWHSNMQKQSVSPSISPISQRSEQQALGIAKLLQQASQGRGMTVSMPMVNLDDSQGSVASAGSEIIRTGK